MATLISRNSSPTTKQISTPHASGICVISQAKTDSATVAIAAPKTILDLDATMFYVTSSKIRFFKPVVPGDQLYVVVTAIKVARIGGVFETQDLVNNEIVAKGEMAFACK